MPYSKSRLFLTLDIYHEDVWFVRTEEERYARIALTERGVDVWMYKHCFEKHFDTLTAALNYVERSFIKYYYETYFGF